MGSHYSIFDRSHLRLRPLSERRHDLDRSVVKPLAPVAVHDAKLMAVAGRIRSAADRGGSVVLMMGAHVLRSGVQRYLIDLLEKGVLSCIAMNGAGVIHDFELAAIGATTESVAHYIRDGRFGLWQETGSLNEIISSAAAAGLGLGEAVGKYIDENNLPHKDISVLAAAWRLKIPVTVHVGIGYDIIHEMPNCNGAALGETSYRDFLIFAKVIEKLEGGVVMNFGSAVMGPEVYLKALAMARNVAAQQGRQIRRFATLVCDLAPLPDDCATEPCKTNPQYYFRPWKTMLARTVADGGESFYVRGRHEETLPQLWSALEDAGKRK